MTEDKPIYETPRSDKPLLGGLDCPDMDLTSKRAKPRRKRLQDPPAWEKAEKGEKR
jgi:hypothetical protein